VHVHVQVLHARPEGDVLRARHVLEQRVALEHEPDAPVLDGDVGRVRVCRRRSASAPRTAAAAPLQVRGRAMGRRLVGRAGARAPSNMIWPEVASSRPAMSRSSVVLPAASST